MLDIARVLRPGGRIVIACRTSDDPIPQWMDPNVYRIPHAAALEAMLSAAGFTAIDRQRSDDDRHHTNWFVGDLPD